MIPGSANALLSVEEAQARVLTGVETTRPEPVAVEAAIGRVLAVPLPALLTQPPFAASAMDGYAVRAADVTGAPASLRVTGTAAAGHPYAGRVEAGDAVRILTGAPIPEGADAVVIQEHTVREGSTVLVRDGRVDAENLRPIGMDFRAGDMLLAAGRRLGPREAALAAAMGHKTVAVRRRPRIAILSTGDELVPPGARPGAGQIVASNHLCVGGMAEAAGAEVIQLGIARDTREDLTRKIAEADGADVLVTIGGASVGEHDLVAPVLAERGLTLAFWKINMRPGKPLMFASHGGSSVLGLPGNPASAMVGARLFLVPLVWAMLGRPVGICTRSVAARLTMPVERNGGRQRYVRAASAAGDDGCLEATPLAAQHSSLIGPLAEADCLIVRPPHAPALPAGTLISLLPLDPR